MKLWILFQWRNKTKPDFVGVFDEEEKALQLCVDETFCLGPAELNFHFPTDKTVTWSGLYYPKLSRKDNDR